MKEKINTIARIFPVKEEVIEQLLLSNPTFLELCTDYMLCSSRILEIKKELEKHNLQIGEYEDLQRKLEEELLKYINKTK
ncbi:hypothetical protein [Algoriphagus sp. NG3]|uniref:hypothetical protein n=1 Tax=unclassified Algoriphagus TaxID=2641541 RepID=UPI002A81489D|nr:hypothetical protein [Algoriphagus sp. NG3]WPR75277.1 hypothetical protein SLW71_21680 [Algoriphagus sp. NG3]